MKCNKNQSGCLALQLPKGTTASIFKGMQVWAKTMNTVKAAKGTKAIYL